MQLGRQQVKETDAALLRSEKIVNDTMAIGIQTAETLQAQTRQLEKVRGRSCTVWHAAAELVCTGAARAVHQLQSASVAAFLSSCLH